MTTFRESFLQQVRLALAAGQRAGMSPSLEDREMTGYQGAGPNPLQRFQEEFTLAGGQTHVVEGIDAAIQSVLALLREKTARQILLGRGEFLDRLDLGPHLIQLGFAVQSIDAWLPPSSRDATFAAEIPISNAPRPTPHASRPERDAFFAADIAISGVKYLIAETGTLVVETRAAEPRSLTLLPLVHIAVAHHSQLLPDLFDLFDRQQLAIGNGLPSCLTLITGPSKTGDIELNLVTGVHGPGELHVVLLLE
jgi:L-lactate dehydrogenase complex protein LldG